MYAYRVQSTFSKSSSLSTTLFMCRVLSEVRSVRPVWVSGTALSASPQRGEPATPRERHAAESTGRSSEAQSTGSVHPQRLQRHPVGIGTPFRRRCFSFPLLPPFISSWQGLEWGQSRGTVQRLRLGLLLLSCPACLLVHDHLPDPISNTLAKQSGLSLFAHSMRPVFL